MWYRAFLFLPLTLLGSCAAAKGIAGVTWGLIKAPGKAVESLFSKDDKDESKSIAVSGKPLTYSERVRREQTAMKTYMKNPNIDPAEAGLAFDLSKKEYQSASFNGDKQYRVGQSQKVTPYSTRDFTGSAEFQNGNQTNRLASKSFRESGKTDLQSTRNFQTSAARESDKIFDTNASRDSGKRADSPTNQGYQEALAQPKTVKDELIKDMYDKPYSAEELQNALQR